MMRAGTWTFACGTPFSVSTWTGLGELPRPEDAHGRDDAGHESYGEDKKDHRGVDTWDPAGAAMRGSDHLPVHGHRARAGSRGGGRRRQRAVIDDAARLQQRHVRHDELVGLLCELTDRVVAGARA